MPKSKRNKIVHLTQVKKKGKDHKEDLMKQIEQYVAQFSRVYLFDFDSTKSDRIMLLRVRLKEFGRIFAGRNAVVTASLKAIAKRSGTNYDDLIKHITGHRGLLFTDISIDKLICTIEKEVPEFREKLLGYAQITPEVREMDVDSGNDDCEEEEEDDCEGIDAEAGKALKKKKSLGKKTMSSGKKKATKTTKKPKPKKKKKTKGADGPHEVKFVKI